MWNAGFNDPAVVAHAVHNGQTAQSLGNATGVPYAGMALGALSVVLTILIGGRRDLKKATPK